MGRLQLDPLAAEHRQPVGRSDEPRDLLARQRLAVEADLDLKVEQRRGADEGRRMGPDRRLDGRAARPAQAPRCRHSHHDSRLLHRLDVAEQPHRFARRPAQRVEDFAGFDNLLQPGAAFARAMNRLEQSQEFALRPRAGVFAQRRAEGRVPKRAMSGERGGVGR